jgi:hypothetical protein
VPGNLVGSCNDLKNTLDLNESGEERSLPTNRPPTLIETACNYIPAIVRFCYYCPRLMLPRQSFKAWGFFLNLFSKNPQVLKNGAVTGSDTGEWVLKNIFKTP